MVYPAIYHVAPREGHWTVEEEQGREPAATCADRDSAMRLGQERARVRHGRVVVYRDDGTVYADHGY